MDTVASETETEGRMKKRGDMIWVARIDGYNEPEISCKQSEIKTLGKLQATVRGIGAVPSDLICGGIVYQRFGSAIGIGERDMDALGFLITGLCSQRNGIQTRLDRKTAEIDAATDYVDMLEGR